MSESEAAQQSVDERAMQAALAAAAEAHHATSPNPMVGAVVVSEGAIIAVGRHRRAGEAHAEVEALRAAGAAARATELVVTLEPCNHHGRTPPCTEAIIRAGVRRVVVAMRDPNPEVRGGGIETLRAAGLDVELGLLAEQAERLNEFYLTWVRRRTPFVTAKFAASLDGRIATRTGASRWISAPASREHTHRLRRDHDAILVGAGTVMADDPTLTTRLHPPARSPLRVVLDSGGRIPVTARVYSGAGGIGALLATTVRAPVAALRAVEALGNQVCVLPASSRGVDLDALLEELGQRRLLSLLVEGGGTVLGSIFDGRLADRVVAMISPRIIGGAQAPAAVAGEGVDALAAAPLLRDPTVACCGPDIVVTGYCVR